jgi:hypothetical protein
MIQAPGLRYRLCIRSFIPEHLRLYADKRLWA